MPLHTHRVCTVLLRPIEHWCLPVGDQLETLLMRMQFGSGLSGLAGMRPLTSMSHLLNSHTAEAQALSVVRPFLELTREDLQAFCTDNELDWVEDPSNSDEKYMRTRMRNLLNGTGANLKTNVFAKALPQAEVNPTRLTPAPASR